MFFGWPLLRLLFAHVVPAIQADMMRAFCEVLRISTCRLQQPLIVLDSVHMLQMHYMNDTLSDQIGPGGARSMIVQRAALAVLLCYGQAVHAFSNHVLGNVEGSL